MWYFSWILGTAMACIFAIMNAVWLELRDDGLRTTQADERQPLP
ncbi:cytochrome bd-I oxidase subunit CydX [Legionella taurinensis]|uniref:Cytochrome bd-I oxidase subunit CydX n=1 Tax=Legionella taurinensis TaxID=70611 RepID=A0A3A5L4E1_9GAMM|nr:cytochrome bd-I oxidase subunit CydX [Legionella taurinensis]MDX1836167.1 cytochrome bd-I oxidase subunit CydX [Legionella taurinensis]PUT42063.1 cytochrome bd-I oxidase subunit CydX [Legionella taurinensis]PUT44850.1 cytochrome bd-I oxidase subunit CydX [Legionella taurinensis]PUT48171.1 cytochrome bd-I oxidase subunit CydX [Legionella taurinensis]PUT48985.1 cytochrome bd-I oxidase subunit CydX [Legionella taurinensis]